MKDSAEIYREKDFPGKKLLGIGAAIWGVWWLSGWVVNFESIPKGIMNIIWIVLLLALIPYFVGFWKAVKGKGYHPILFLISFTGIIGILVIYFLPNQNENQPAQVNPCNPPANPTIN